MQPRDTTQIDDHAHQARALVEAGDRDGAAWAFHRAARCAYELGVDDRALGHARDGLAIAAEPRAIGWLSLLMSELAAAAGDAHASARHSVAAERALETAADGPGVLLVRATRTLRALLGGDGEAGDRQAAALVPELDAAAQRVAAAWLRIGRAQRALDDDRVTDALTFATEVLETAPPERAERLVAAGVAARALAAMERPIDAAQVAAAALAQADDTAPGPVRALAYQQLGEALADGQDQLAHVCLDLADGLRAGRLDDVLARLTPDDPW